MTRMDTHRADKNEGVADFRLFAVLFLAVATILTIGSCSDSRNPLDALAGLPITSISVSQDHGGRTVLITEPEDIHFITTRLIGLRTHREGKVNPEFHLVFASQGGASLRLRLGRDCIGPAVPASDVVLRWYFDDGAVYDFILERLGHQK